MIRILKAIFSAMGTGARAFVALVGVAGITIAVANYTMTQGSGTTFGSIAVATVHYIQALTCDPTTPSQCGAVDANGQQKFDVNTSNNNLFAAVTSPITLGSTTGGSQVKTLIGLTNSAQTVKASAGQAYGVQCYNPDASADACIALFDTTPVTLGTTSPKKFVCMGGKTNTGFAYSAVGNQFTTTIVAAAGTTPISATAPTTALNCTVDYN